MCHRLVIPREGAAIPGADGTFTSIRKIAELFNNQETQAEALSLLGVHVHGDRLSIQFYNHSSPSTGDAEVEIHFDCSLSKSPQFPLQIHVDLDVFTELGVNFFGRVKFTDSREQQHSIPLTGLGTVALEGRHNDSRSGFFTGADAASFQQRVALTLAVVMVMGVQTQDVQKLMEEFRIVDSKLYGRPDVLEYAYRCADFANTESYFRFMLNKYDHDGVTGFPPMLEAFQTGSGVLEDYFVELESAVQRGMFKREWIDIKKAEDQKDLKDYTQPIYTLVIGCVIITAIAIYINRKK